MPIDLSVNYMGLRLKSPFVPSASPHTESLTSIRRMEDAGASAIVLHSLFEEQILEDQLRWVERVEARMESHPEALSYFPLPMSFGLGPDAYLDHIARAKEAVDIPIIASLNGCSYGGWLDYATLIQDAGADAIELNIYSVPTDPDLSSEEIEGETLEIARRVLTSTHLPVAVKLSPFYTNLARMARQLDEEGVHALVLFNRFYQPDIDPELLEISPRILLSSSTETRLPMRWIAILYGRLRASIAATSGIHRAADAIKMIMAGADVTMLCAALFKRGLSFFETIEQDTREWLELHEYRTLSELQGCMSQLRCPDPAAFERAQYVRAVSAGNHGLAYAP